MRRTITLAALAAVPLLLNNSPLQSQGKDNVTAQVVTYDELAKEVVKHRGKVVLVDMWHLM